MTELEALQNTYHQMLGVQDFDHDELDYGIVEKHRVFLNQLAQVENSAISVFDMARQEHVFSSINFQSLLGYSLDEIEREGNAYFDSRIHPEDLLELIRNGIRMLAFLPQVPIEERKHYKFITEYRLRNGTDEYIRVIEQHQPLELDNRGNVWLALGMVDISPNQEPWSGVRSQLVNYKTGQIVPSSAYPAAAPTPAHPDEGRNSLTGRERQVLGLIKNGLLSKEISDLLSISIHTVNTHRQRILEKTNANNMMEAIRYAQGLGVMG